MGEPKVLFFTSEVPQSVNAGSMQLYRVLTGYPSDRLLVLGARPEADASLLPCRYEAINLITHRLACTRVRGWTIGLNALTTLVEPQLPRSLALARAFAPDVVVTVMDKMSYYKHAWALARALPTPLLTITMDDPQAFEPAHPILRRAQRTFIRRMLADTALSLGVSQEMCGYLREKFGKPSEEIYFGPPDDIRPRVAALSRARKHARGLILGYAGSLGLGYREGLTALLEALERSDSKLYIYTRDQHCVIEHPNVENRGYLPPHRLWATVQAECDAVVQPYAFDGPFRRVYRTHFPTKLSEYCWAGMPMLVVGPEDATGLLWARRHPQAALAASSASAAVLAPLFERLRDDGSLRESLSGGAAEIARAQFDPVAIRARFREFIRRAAQSGRAAARAA